MLIAGLFVQELGVFALTDHWPSPPVMIPRQTQVEDYAAFSVHVTVAAAGAGNEERLQTAKAADAGCGPHHAIISCREIIWYRANSYGR